MSRFIKEVDSFCSDFESTLFSKNELNTKSWVAINSPLLSDFTAASRSTALPWKQSGIATMGVTVSCGDSIQGPSVICCYVQNLEKLQFQWCGTKFSRQLLQCGIFSALRPSISSSSLDSVAGSPAPTWSLPGSHFLSHSSLACSVLGSRLDPSPLLTHTCCFRHPPQIDLYHTTFIQWILTEC